MQKRFAQAGDPARYFQPRRTQTLIINCTRLLLILIFVASQTGMEARAQGLSEYTVKAAFLYNFAKFVEWPAGAFGNGNSSFIVGVVGNDPFGSTLDQAIVGKAVNGRPLEVKRFSRGQNLRECHILFISSSESKRLPQILDSLRGAGILTISETDQFIQQGGIINFVIEQGKVRFEINGGAAEKARLRLSSKLLALAKSVRQ